MLELSMALPWDQSLSDRLDLAKTDDKLVAIVSALVKSKREHNVALLTADRDLRFKAVGCNVEFKLIPKEWMLEEQVPDEDKELQQLRNEVANYARQEPSMHISLVNPEHPNHKSVTITTLAPITADQLDELVARLSRRHPLQQDWHVMKPAMQAFAMTRFEPPSPAAIEHYRDIDYPHWLALCKSMFAGLHQHPANQRPLRLRLAIENRGERPAREVRLEIRAEGPLTLRRPPDEVHDAQAPLQPELPPPPCAPQIRELPAFQGLEAFARQHVRHGGNIGAVVAGLSSGMDDHDSAQSIPRTQWRYPDLELPLAVGAVGKEALVYENWEEGACCSAASLTCSFWRHQSTARLIEFDVLFESHHASGGRILCEVHAENLTTPISFAVIVKQNVDATPLYRQAVELIDATATQSEEEE
ncbi:hypothetical protein GCM10022278_40580 [Allohahella marinimesophila]|uniref:PIN domain-containing protein n=1 Tax=Allohahella marinimesophila TaxID=1054972 RepID=A0ABP7QDF3_9GAMM